MPEVVTIKGKVMEAEEIQKTTQQLIREIGNLVHADEELNQDNLPVYFRMELPGHFWLVVDMIHKDEIGVDCPTNGYKVINQIVSDLVIQIALAHIEMVRHRGTEITCFPQPHVLEPKEIPPETPMSTGGDNET